MADSILGQNARSAGNTDERLKKTRIGVVISNKMNKTVVVSVESLVKHPLYGKYIKRQVKYMAHDEDRKCEEGDKVKIAETRPMSKLKRWRVVQVLEKA